MPDRLLAKSRGPREPFRPSMLLPVHLADVHRAAGQVLDATGDDQLRALGLAPEHFGGRFRRAVLLAALAHDLGKANDHFQGMLDGSRGDAPQGLRHEWATVLILEEPAVRDWLRPAVECDADWHVAQWAVAGHHPAHGRPSPPRLAVDGTGERLTLLLDHPDFALSLRCLGAALGLGEPPGLGRRVWPLVGAGDVFTWLAGWRRRAAEAWGRLWAEERRLAAAVKACLVAADVAGSALPREVPDEADRAAWVARAFATTPPPGRLRRIVDRRRGGSPLRVFQEEVARSDAPVTLVRAGCGSGKTLAAYHWAATRHPGRRLYFCYPTTGTATEGFRDYLFAPEEDLDADLFHGRAAVDLEIVLGVRGDDGRDEAGAATRIEALDAWSTPCVSCTVDTVLGLVQNNRRGLYAWPALAGAAFVFDEVHAYDDRLFGALLRFLQALPGAPALLMTASLPAARREALVQCLRRRGGELQEVTGPPELERRLRYRRQGAVDARDPLPEVRAELGRGGKVLWVCNTVDRAMGAAERAADLMPLIYHSRFRYEDRVERHRRVIEAFRADGPALAVCTQVAEMSLDLSATLLVTDLAPVPSLIQRLGRPEPPRGRGRPLAVRGRRAGARRRHAGGPAVRGGGLRGRAPLAGGVGRAAAEPGRPGAGLGGARRRAAAGLRGQCLAGRRPGDAGAGAARAVAGHHRRAGRGRAGADVGPEGPGPRGPADAAPAARPAVAGVGRVPRRPGRARGGRGVPPATRCPMAKVKAPAPDRLRMELFAPGMTALHRAGLGGLACTLRHIERAWEQGALADEEAPGGPWPDGRPPWEIDGRSVLLLFGGPERAREYLRRLFALAFGLRDGLIYLPGQYAPPAPGVAVRADLQLGLTLTFLQHNKARGLAKEPQAAQYDPEGDGVPGVTVEYRTCSSYAHQVGWKDLTSERTGCLVSDPGRVSGPLLPGAVVRHVAFDADTRAEDPPGLLLPLYFALVGALALPVSRRVAALIVPEVDDLLYFAEARPLMTPTSARECQIAGAADGALQAQVRLRARQQARAHALPGCLATTFMPTAWASKQKSRVATLSVPPGDDLRLDRFAKALALLPPRVVTRTVEGGGGPRGRKGVPTRAEAFRADSGVRPLVAENLALGRPWYAGFVRLMTALDANGRPLRDRLRFERKGLHAMTATENPSMWDHDREAALVRAVHEALRCRYGQIAGENKGNPVAMKKRFGAEYDRRRLAFAGAKTADQFRNALCDLFSRAGNNRVLRECWADVLPLLADRQWQLARDLALLALASYSGQGPDDTEGPAADAGDAGAAALQEADR
jgi:CRISPR-associated endonuclease/helicase Cas3